MSQTSPIRVSYVGPIMDLVAEAYEPAHEQHGHSVNYYESPEHLALDQVPPDVVVCNPLARTHPGTIEGACALQAVVPDRTLIVCLFTRVGHSHAMFVQHALAGNCHDRMLLHYPLPNVSVEMVVAKIDKMARGQGGGKLIQSVDTLPRSLLPFVGNTTDLGDIMAGNEALGRLIYTAATYRGWSNFNDLAREMNLSEGTTKNQKLLLKKELVEANLFPADLGWTVSQFVRFVVEYQPFILAYGHKHLNMDPPPSTGE